MVVPINATGWGNFINGKLVESVYELYDDAFFGMHLAIPILLILTQIMLYVKARSPVLSWAIGMFTAALYLTSVFIDPIAKGWIIGILILELLGILYYLIFMNK